MEEQGDSGKRAGRMRLLTETQHGFAHRVREFLKLSRVAFDERLEAAGAEAWYVFQIASCETLDLTVSITVVDDAFVFEANGAPVRRHRSAWSENAADQWMDECLRLLGLFLHDDLVIRVRKTLTGRITGAVRIPGAVAEWDGDSMARTGVGQEFVFTSWYKMQ